MANRNECDGCGLAACDLPDGVIAELVFEFSATTGETLCQGCLNAMSFDVFGLD